MEYVGSFTVAPHHPALPGHFPGNPVVPGVVLLDHAEAAILAADPGLAPMGFQALKFFSPVRAGETIEVHCRSLHGATMVPFICMRNGERVVAGRLVARL